MAKKAKKKPVTKQQQPQQQQQHEFNRGDFVAAKVKGYPSWPGRVEEIDPANKRKRYLVRFFGTCDKANTFVELKPFEALTESEKACSKKGFKEALAECQREYDLARKGKNKKSDKISPRKRSERGAAKKTETKLEPEIKSKDEHEPEIELKDENEPEIKLNDENELEIKSKDESELEIKLKEEDEPKIELKDETEPKEGAEAEKDYELGRIDELDGKIESRDEVESKEKNEPEKKSGAEEKPEAEQEAELDEKAKLEEDSAKVEEIQTDEKVELKGGDKLEEKVEAKNQQLDLVSTEQTVLASASPTLSSNQKHEPMDICSSTSVNLDTETEKKNDNRDDVNVTEEKSDDKEGKLNETENTNLDDTDRNDCLPDSKAPDDQCQLQTGSTKSDESSKNCSLNDLTSEQANADRGTQTSTDSIKIDTKKELTLAKLKKKIEDKLKEKDKKKKERIEKKSFDKASKILPKFIQIFNPLSESSSKLVGDFNDKKAAKQFKTSVKNCEKYLDSLEKCLKLLASKYGKEQKESNEFHQQMSGISEALKKIRDSSSSEVKDEARRLLDGFKQHKAIKKFINDQEIPMYHNNLIVERKENSKKRRKLDR